METDFSSAEWGLRSAEWDRGERKEHSVAWPQPKTEQSNRETLEKRGKLHFALAQEILAKLSGLDG